MSYVSWPAHTLAGKYLRERFPRVLSLNGGPPYRGEWEPAPGDPSILFASTPVPIPLPGGRAMLVADLPTLGSTLGTAFEYRLDAWYAPSGWIPRGASKGRARALRSQGYGASEDASWTELLNEFTSLADTVRGIPRVDLDGPAEDRLIRLAVLLALYQQVAVSEGRALPNSPVARFDATATVDDMACAVFDDMVVAVSRLMELANDRLPDPSTYRTIRVEPSCHPWAGRPLLGRPAGPGGGEREAQTPASAPFPGQYWSRRLLSLS